MSIIYKLQSSVLYSLIVLLLISVSAVKATEAPRQYFSAQWFLSADELQERVKNSVWLTLISEQEITGMITVPILKVNDLFVEKNNSGPIYTTKMIDGKRQHVAQIKYDIYPAKAGEFTLPAMPISISPANKEIEPITLQSESLELVVTAQAAASRGLIITPSLTVSQKVSEQEFIAGGIISREVILTVKDLPGYLIADLPLTLTSAEADIRVTQNSTHTDTFRGAVNGKRNTELQYRYSKPGNYTLPAINVKWWNATRGVEVQSGIAAIDIVVLPPPPLPLKQRVQAFYKQTIEVIQANKGILMLMMLSIVLVWWVRGTIIKWVNQLILRLKNMMKIPYIQSLIFISKITFTPKTKLVLLLEKWAKGINKPLQKTAEATSSTITYNQQGDISIARLALLKQVSRVAWLQYYQRFTLQPLNPI